MTRHHRVAPVITAEEARARLARGNARFVGGHARFLTGLRDLRAALAHAQRPWATILGCSDSRVPPELIFDAGLGELFVIRVAGNVATPGVMGTLHYAVEHLGTPLLVVLGHRGCGAVQAALDRQQRAHWKEEGIEVLMRAMLPGLADLDPALDPEARMAAAVEANVRWVLRRLREMPQARREREDATIVGAVYELTTGRVRFLS
jgi:carbonic anhydrase